MFYSALEVPVTAQSWASTVISLSWSRALLGVLGLSGAAGALETRWDAPFCGNVFYTSKMTEGALRAVWPA